MGQFDWDTDEEEDVWSEIDSADERPSNRKQVIRRLLLGLGVLLFLAAAGLIAYRFANNTIETATEETEQAVLASYNLVREASQNNDPELLSNLISGRDPSWVRAQQKLSRDELWFDRPSLDLTYRGEFEGTPQPPTVTLSSDLNTATIETVVTYEYGPDGEPIKLIQTELYRRGETSWLLAPLDTDYWNSVARFESPFIEATFPLADQEVGKRLTQDLSQMLANMCDGYFELDCERLNLPLEIDFSVDPQALIEMEEVWDENLSSIDRLPAPTLIGRPTDEASYIALYEAYATYLFWDWLRVKQEVFWGADANAGRDIAPMAAQLRFNAADPNYLPTSGTPEAKFLTDVSQELALLCLQPEGIELIHIDSPEESNITILEEGFKATEIITDEADERLALQGIMENEMEIKVWPLDSQQSPITIRHNYNNSVFVELTEHPDGARLIIGNVGSQSSGVEMFTLICSARTCTPQQIDLVSQLAWSPDGAYTASITDRIFLGNEEGLPIRFIGNGQAAHWVDNTTLRFLGSFSPDPVTSDNNLDNGLLEFDVDGELELLVTKEDLQSILPDSSDGVGFLILTALPLENNRTLLFAAKDNFTELYHFVVDHNTEEIRLVWSDQEPQLFSFLPSSDGKYLAQNTREDGFTSLILYDLEDDRAIQIGRNNPDLRNSLPETVTLDWSLDGRSLLITANGEVMVYDTEVEELFYWPLPEAYHSCFDAEWIAGD